MRRSGFVSLCVVMVGSYVGAVFGKEISKEEPRGNKFPIACMPAPMQCISAEGQCRDAIMTGNCENHTLKQTCLDGYSPLKDGQLCKHHKAPGKVKDNK